MEQAPLVEELSTMYRQVFMNLPVILGFLMVFENIRKLSPHQLIQLYTLCYEITFWLGNKKTRKAVCNKLGKVYYDIARYNDAMKWFKELLDISIETDDVAAMVVAYCNIGNVYQSLGQYQSAMERHKESLRICQEKGDLAGQGKAYCNIGIVHRALGKYQDALTCHKEHLRICQETKDISGQGKAYCNIGNVHQFLGRYRDALKCHKEHLRLCQETGNIAGQAKAYGNIGRVYQSLGRYQDALKCHKEHLRICQEIGIIAGQGNAYGNIGNVYQSLGRYQDALKCHEEDLRICQETGNIAGKGNAYGNVGNVHQSLGQYQYAMECHKEHLCICQGTGNIAGQGKAYGNIGNVHKSLGQYQYAMECYNKCLSICQDLGDIAGQGNAYGNIGVVHQSLGQYNDAMECYNKCLRICQELGDISGQGKACANIGRVYQSQGLYQDALKRYKECLHICQKTGDIEGKAIIYQNIGTMCISLNDKPVAESNLTQSLKCFEELFISLQHDDFKTSIVDTYIETYKYLAYVFIESGKMHDALLALERGRAQALRDKLLIQHKQPAQPMEGTEARNEDIPSLVDSSDSSFLFFSLSPFEQMYTFVTARDMQLCFKGMSREVIGALVCHPSTEDLEQMLKSHVMKVIQYMNDFARTEEDNTTFHKYMSDQKPSQNVEVSPLDGMLMNLYKVLIAPVEDELTQPNISIIPEGPLFLVPFAALKNREGRYLSDYKCIRVSPSLTTLKILRDCPDDMHCKHGAVIVGGPIPGEVMFRDKKITFPELPFAIQEAEKIADMLCETALTGESATKVEVLHRMQEGVAIIHIATTTSETTEGLLLAPRSRVDNRIPVEEDYLLTINDIYSSRINARLVVLSSCHTGRGEIRAEGVVGLTRAFLAAGARSVLASLWSVDDKASGQFMEFFYGHLTRGESASASLQQAMRKMRQSKEFYHPYYWAGYFIVGDDITLPQK